MTPEMNARLVEALTWAVGFIRCNFPRTVAPYPDYRNACDLLAEMSGGTITGEFTLALARAELAEGERDRLRAELAAERERCAGLLSNLWAAWDGGSDKELMRAVCRELGISTKGWADI